MDQTTVKKDHQIDVTLRLKDKVYIEIVDLLQSIVNGREGWCGDHGVYTPQLNSKSIRALLKSFKKGGAVNNE